MANSEGPPGKAREPAKADASEQDRDFVNIVAAVFVIALILGAFWVFQALQRHNDIENCIASGRRNCIDLLHPDAPPP